MAYLNREQMLHQDQALRAYQARADDALSTWGLRAPAPTLSDDPRYPERYRRELLYLAKKRLPEDHQLRKFQVKHIPFDAFQVVEPQIYQACREAAYRPDSVPLGEMRRVEERDSNGMRVVKWIGQEHFVKQMGRPGRRVISFNTSNGPVAASGQFLR
jgi:hypothetical protein